MAIITGYTVTYTDYTAPTTPRLINIPDAWGDVTVQDLWDTLSEEAAKPTRLMYKKLIQRTKSGGKNILSPTKKSGIILVMDNVKVKFFDQPGPTFVKKRVIDGDLLAIDSAGLSMDPISTSSFTNFEKESAVSAVILQDTQPHLTLPQFVGLK